MLAWVHRKTGLNGAAQQEHKTFPEDLDESPFSTWSP